MIQFFKRLSLSCLIALPVPVLAQTAPEQPLSVIDWLGQQPRPGLESPPPFRKADEPPVAKTALPPVVTVTPLGEGTPRVIGLVPANVTGLPQNLWANSDMASIRSTLDLLPDLNLPAARALYYTLLLAEATAPEGLVSEGDALALARVRALMDAGALDPAHSLIEQAGIATSPEHFDLWMQISLLLGTEDRACQILNQKPYLSKAYGVHILCSTRAGNWENAALTLGSAQALELLPEPELAVLDRFLNPDLFEGEPPLPAPRVMDPLTFRMLESIGEPQPTRNLPTAYAVADLRDIAGWKSQLEAAERLTRVGALPDNRFLGIHTAREPAASGGIWDRVEALQRFDTVISTQNVDAITKTLGPAWRAMQEAELEVSFATLYADALAGVDLEGSSAALRDRIVMLSPLYETASPAPSTEMTFLSAIAKGDAPQSVPDIRFADAIAGAFTTPTPREVLIRQAKEGQLGVAILRTLSLLEDGARGDTGALRDAVSTLRALGLEDTARRASLQVLLLERG